MRNDIKRVVKISYNLNSEFDDITPINNELAIVTLNNYKGIINPNGKFILPLDYDYIYDIDDEYICVNHYGEYKYYNKNGKNVIPNKYYYATPFKNDIAKVQDTKDDEPYYINRNGIRIKNYSTDVLEERYNKKRRNIKITSNENVEKNKNLYRILAKHNYKKIDDFYNGLAIVQNKNNGYYGFINIKGELVIPLIFKEVKNYSNNLIAVKDDNSKWYFINLKGEKIKLDCYYLMEYKDYLKPYEDFFPTDENTRVEHLGYYVYADYKKYFISKEEFESFLIEDNKKPFKRG